MDVETVSAQQNRDGLIPKAFYSFYCNNDQEPSPLAILAKNNIAND